MLTCHSGCYTQAFEAEWRESAPYVFVKLWLFFFGMGREQDCFQTVQSLSWIFWGFVPLPYLFFFSDFSRLDSSLYGHYFGSYCEYLIVLPPHLACAAHVSAVGQPIVPWIDWKVNLSCTLRCLE